MFVWFRLPGRYRSRFCILRAVMKAFGYARNAYLSEAPQTTCRRVKQAPGGTKNTEPGAVATRSTMRLKKSVINRASSRD